jgi:hypothetical protein
MLFHVKQQEFRAKQLRFNPSGRRVQLHASGIQLFHVKQALPVGS